MSPVLLDIQDGIAWITLNRPDVGNAINLDLALALFDASVRCQTDEGVRCVVLQGAGRLFCAGGDVTNFAAAGQGVPALLSKLAGTLHMAIARLARMPKPLVVLVNGPAAGAGMSLAIGGDIVIAAQASHFTAAYGALALTPDAGMSWILPRLVGLRKAQEIILTNRRVHAEEAERIGLVTSVVEDKQLLVEGRRMAERLASMAVSAIGSSRALLQESFTSGFETQLERETRSISAAGNSAEFQERLSTFVSKRIETQ